MYLRIHYGSCTRFAAAVEIRAHNVDVVPGSSAPLPQRGFANDLLHGGCGVRGDLEEEAGTALDCTSIMCVAPAGRPGKLWIVMPSEASAALPHNGSTRILRLTQVDRRRARLYSIEVNAAFPG